MKYWLIFLILLVIWTGQWGEATPVDPYACITDEECERIFGFPMDDAMSSR